MGCLAAALGFFTYYYNEEAQDFEALGVDFDDINLFDRNEFVFFDWAIYANFAANAFGLVSAVLAVIALCKRQPPKTAYQN